MKITISHFISLPEWEKKTLLKHEQERVKRMTDILDSLADHENLSAEAYTTIMQTILG